MISSEEIQNDFRIFKLDHRANEYIKEIAEEYSVVISKDKKYPQFFILHLLQEVDFAKGTVSTCLPRDTDTEEVYQFTHAKIDREKNAKLLHQGLVVKVQDTSEWLVPLFKECLDSSDKSAILFDSIYTRPTDPYLAKINEKKLTTENEVLYFLTNQDSSPERIKSVMQLANGAHPPLFAICSTLPESLHVGGRLSPGDIEDIVDNISTMVIGAYDGDSYLVWKRN